MASILNLSAEGANGPVGVKVLQRNRQYPAMAAQGYNCHRVMVHDINDIDILINNIKTHGEDGKLGLRLHKPKSPGLVWLQQNTALFSIGTLAWQNIPDKLKRTWDLQYDNKIIVLQKLQEAKAYMAKLKPLDKGREVSKSNKWLFSKSALQVTIGVFQGVKCKGCFRPHYEHVVKPNSFHVCTYCGMEYKYSNIQLVPQLRMNEEGEQVGFHHAPQNAVLGENWMSIKKTAKKCIVSQNNITYKKKTENQINIKIGMICDVLRCDGGDAEHFIRKYAWKKYELYSNWLFKEGKWDGKRNVMGQWSIAAVFVWYSILQLEARIMKSSVWTLSEICKAANELQLSDAYIPNYAKKRKRDDVKAARKTRAVKLETVHRYACEIATTWKQYDRAVGMTIPALTSIDVLRTQGEDMKTVVDVYAECQGKKSIIIPMPYNQPWDLDIVLDKKLIKIEPDTEGLGFQLGLRKGDIIRAVNGVSCPTNVEGAYDLIVAAKNKRTKTEEKVKPIKLTILR